MFSFQALNASAGSTVETRGQPGVNLHRPTVNTSVLTSLYVNRSSHVNGRSVVMLAQSYSRERGVRTKQSKKNEKADDVGCLQLCLWLQAKRDSLWREEEDVCEAWMREMLRLRPARRGMGGKPLPLRRASCDLVMVIRWVVLASCQQEVRSRDKYRVHGPYPVARGWSKPA